MKGCDGRSDADVGRLRATGTSVGGDIIVRLGAGAIRLGRCVTPHFEIFPKGKDLRCLVKLWDPLEHFKQR